MRNPLGSGRPALEALAAHILDHLEAHGESAIHTIPGRWPATRQQVRLVVRLLAYDGLVQLRTTASGDVYARLRKAASAA